MVDLNINFDIPLLTKMWETLDERFIATWMSPKRIEREGMAHLRLDRAERFQAIEFEGERLDAEVVQIPYTRSNLDRQTEPHIDFQRLAEIEQKKDYIRKQTNLGKSILHAESELNADDPVPEKEVNPDWLYRWREYAENFSTDDMQMLWGKILAGEFKNPGAFNYRALDTLSSLSKDDAEVFLLLCSLTVSEPGVAFIFSNGDIAKKHGFAHLHMLRLRELGLLSYSDSSYTISEDKFFYFRKHQKGIQFLPKKETSLGVCLLTTVGHALYGLVDVELNLPYFEDILRFHAKSTKVDSIFVSKVEVSPDGVPLGWKAESVEKFSVDGGSDSGH